MSTIRRPKFNRAELESDSDNELDYALNQTKKGTQRRRSEDSDSDSGAESDDGMSTLSFGALSSAQRKLNSSKQIKGKGKNYSASESDSDSAPEETGFFEEDDEEEENQHRYSNGKNSGKEGETKKTKNKHAPVENKWSTRPLNQHGVHVREIPGLLDGTKYKKSSKHRDIRFDPAFGKADEARVREDYRFLDEYRQKEIDEMTAVLKDPQQSKNLSFRQRENLEYKLQVTKSKLETMQMKDFEKKVIREYRKENGGKFLTKAEQRKLLQVKRFENMKKRQIDKVIERKRKRKLGQEFKRFEFHRN